jgi:ribonuclease BN (tRNA processing enzyme)
MKIIPLGTAGFFPTYGKETMSVLLVEGDTALIFDAGTGIKRLIEPTATAALSNVTSLHVIFSHFHHDHTSGFTWLLRLWPSPRELHVHVPGPKFVTCDGVEVIRGLTTLPLFAAPLDSWGNVSSVKTFDTDSFEVGGLVVQTLKQEHAGGSVGFRVGAFGYVTDTEPGAAHVDFLRACNLVLMDTMMDISDYEVTKSKDPGPAQHGSSASNGVVAAEASIERLGLVHVDPQYEPPRVANLLEEASRRMPQAFLPREGTLYQVSNG